MNNKQRIWTLFFGIITALVIVVSQLFWFQATTPAKKSAVEEQTATPDEEGSQQAHISLPSSSLPSTNTVVVNHEFSFIHEILFEEESTSETASTLVSATGKFFQTLFRTAISPNAP